MVHCNQCGYEWEPRGGIPVACTRCKRYDWKAEKKERRYGRSKDVDTGAAVGLVQSVKSVKKRGA